MEGRNWDDAHSDRHFRTRAVGQLWMGPIQAKGYDNRVVGMTMQEVEFKNSVESQRFMDYLRRKYAAKGQMMSSRRLKHISMDDDR